MKEQSEKSKREALQSQSRETAATTMLQELRIDMETKMTDLTNVQEELRRLKETHSKQEQAILRAAEALDPYSGQGPPDERGER